MHTMSQELIRSLILSIPKGVKAVSRARWATKY